jgi:hypothetical protein
MIPAIACSIYIFYLYFKLNPTLRTEPSTDRRVPAALQAELDQLNARIDALERGLSARQVAVKT